MRFSDSCYQSYTAKDLGYLSDPRDLRLLGQGLSTSRDIVAKLRREHSLTAAELLPGPAFGYCSSTSGSSYLKVYADMFINTYFHGCGTCPMRGGSGSSGPAVDEDLRLAGLKNVRVCDASVVPARGIPNSPIAALCQVLLY